MTTSDFDYHLPESLIAQKPADRRDRSRLMRLQRSAGRVSHHVFADLPDLLREGDLLVFNDTKVIPARFFCRRATGGQIEGLFLQQLEEGRWEVMLRNAGRCKIGEGIELENSAGVQLILREDLGKGRYIVQPAPEASAAEILSQAGRTPLPPYIRRGKDSDDTADHDRYQTVYAERPGAVAAPTAGLHFTEELIQRLTSAGMQQARVTLHVGMGTFQPVKVDRIDEHKMHSEWYELSEQTAETLNQARRDGRRIIAVGTTSVRVLETVARDCDGFPLSPASGWTDIFISPPSPIRAIDGLITNFHLPKSTLLMLVAALCSPGSTDGLPMILSAYQQAVENRYRFFSYGDAMLIE
ncbi:MAG: tRNA preQ1(34) S-adenosylmethionine ribosyltransferase-isomerase QueA [Phycisphaerae bacterium]